MKNAWSLYFLIFFIFSLYQAIQVSFKFETKTWLLCFLFSGQKFAMLEIKSNISQVLRCFKVVESDSEVDRRLSYDFVLKPANGLKVKLQLR
jgi:hypothetical protein